MEVVISDDDFTTASEMSDKPDLPKSTHRPKPSKRKLDTTIVEKVQWTDDEDDHVSRSSKKRKVSAKKKPLRKVTSRGRSSKAIRKKKRRSLDTDDSDASLSRSDSDSDSDSDSLEKLLPEYIRTRREEFDENHKILREAGLRLPPDYSDLYFSDDERLGELEEKPQFDEKSGIKPCQPYKDVILKNSGGVIPASIAQYLRDYQIQGVQFLHELFVYQKGGILGDDMGLGKTVQVAAFLTAAFGKTGDRRDAKRMRKFRRGKDDWYPRALIICPGSLLQNWKSELGRWGWWEIDLYHGTSRDDVLGTARSGRLEIMITTYSTYRNSCEEVNRVPWDVVVADECHTIKDIKAGITKAMNQVNALCRIGLTGTAIQNRYEELWALLNWTNPGRFGTMADWVSQICKPLTIGQSHDATLYQLSEARKTAKKLRFNLLPQFFLRRMKSLIADQLPKKKDRVVFCSLSNIQREAYENLLASPLVRFVLDAFDTCPCGSNNKKGWCCQKVNAEGESWRPMVFPIVMSLQKLSNHFNLLIPRTADTIAKHQRELRFLQAAMPHSWKEHYRDRESLLNLANQEYCGKWKVLKQLLKFWHNNGDKVLVFSHSVRLLKILQHLFNNTSYSVSYLDGSMKNEERQEVVDDFNSDPNKFVFLISTKAGGVGLNITSANKVVIMDPHWNPAYDLQAQDRAYRIGQVRDVDVYRLVSTGTIEEITYARQIYKQQQANIGYSASNERRYFKGVQQDKDRKGEIFGIHNLLTYNGDQGVLRDIVNKTNVAEARVGVRLMDIDMNKVVEDAEDSQIIKKEEGANDETGGLKHLSTLLTREDNKDGILDTQNAKPKPKTDPIQAILASVGVEYTHENSEVVGSSKVEDELSRQAEMATSPTTDGTDQSSSSAAAAAALGLHDEYNPPEDVMQRQFCTMAQTFGFPSATDFALAVEGMTQAQRRNCLDLFYKKRADKFKNHLAAAGLKPDDPEANDGERRARPPPLGASSSSSTPDIEGGRVKEEKTTTTGDVESYYAPPATKGEQPEVAPLGGDDASPVKGETVVPIKRDRQSISIWLSDDDETDEL
ncbi:P-loop containing nucleoside triphosphate hydrolase protein [Biscogniauxia mediterranea]|nr:P-loop containing nucleoside triphosphate hydrolase protein [Biscogniauxia mediterranea]